MDLNKEIEYINSSLFDGGLSPDIVSNYLDAQSYVFCSPLSSEQENLIIKIVTNKLDIEAIEYFLRLKKNNNILTKKLHILSYLIESNRDYNALFINDKNKFVTGFMVLVYYSFRSCFLLLKGFYQCKRYQLV